MVASKERNKMENDMTVTRGSGVALWRQIQSQLESEITSGVLKPGSRCSSEHELAKRFGVNRHTLRRAVAALAQRGLVKVQQGRGIYVTEPVIEYRLSARTRFHENVTRQNRSAGSRLLHAAYVAADTVTAGVLSVSPGTVLVLLHTLGEADGRPISLADHFFVAERFPNLIESYRRTGSISAALAADGVTDYIRKMTHLSTRMPDRGEAEHLDQPVSRPVLVSKSVSQDLDNRPIEFGITLFAGDRVNLLVEH
jgi:GntR family phosphonate transport system transcriptional regulator